ARGRPGAALPRRPARRRDRRPRPAPVRRAGRLPGAVGAPRGRPESAAARRGRARGRAGARPRPLRAGARRGRRARRVPPPPPGDRQVAAWAAALERDGRWEGELTHTARDGRVLRVESRQVMVEEDGRRHVLASNRDVTGRRRAEEALRVLAEASRELVSSLDYETTL